MLLKREKISAEFYYRHPGLFHSPGCLREVLAFATDMENLGQKCIKYSLLFEWIVCYTVSYESMINLER